MLSRRAAAAVLASIVRGSQPQRTDMFADAEAYERFMGRWSRRLAPLLLEFAGVKDGGRVLDVGCGTGVLAFSLAAVRKHCSVVGIDPSRGYAEFARSRNTFGERVLFEVGDAQRLPFPNASFDSSVSLLVWNFIPDGAKALQEVVRVTKAGGAIAATVWDYSAGMKMLRLFWDAAVSVNSEAASLDERHMPLCRAGELKRLWAGGLEQVEERPLEFVMHFESFADYWDPFLLGQGPAGAFLRRIEPPRQAAIRSEVKRRLGVISETKPFDLAARAWAVRGVVPVRNNSGTDPH